MRLLVIPGTWAYGFGPVATAMAVAEAALRQGHEVAAFCNERAAPTIRRAGIHAFEAPIAPGPVYPTRPVHRLADAAAALGFADYAFVHSTVLGELKAIRTFRADAIFNDYQLTAPISGEAAGVPVASTFSWPDHPEFLSPLFTDEPSDATSTATVNRVLSDLGLPAVNNISELLYQRSPIKIAATYPLIDPFIANIPGVHYVGHICWEAIEQRRDLSWLEELDKRETRLILVYFSVGEIGPSIYSKVIPEAFEGSDFTVAIATGTESNIMSGQALPNVHFETFLPMSHLFPKCQAVIFHAGRNTVMNVLQSGVPSLAFAGMDTERDFYARRLDALGVGIRCQDEQFTAASVRSLIEVVSREPYSTRAKQLAANLGSLGGATAIVRIIESHLAALRITAANT